MYSISPYKGCINDSVLLEMLYTFQLSKGEDSMNEGATLTV